MPVPERIARAAKARVQASVQQITDSVAAIESGEPMRAEPDTARLRRRFRAVTGLAEDEVTSLLQGHTAPLRRLIGEPRLSAERIQGQSADFVGVSFLQLARAAASCVGRVIFRNGDPQGSGFMISPHLFLTNNHVLADVESASRFYVEFDYELDVFGKERIVTRFELDPATFFYTNSEDDLDFTLVALGRRIQGTGELSQFGYCPLLRRNDKHSLGEAANIVQHPEGDFKQIVLRENRWVNRLDTVLHYVADTLPGSSGSPVYNDQWEVVALHHWGEPFRQLQLPNGQTVDRNVNEGIRISAIAADLTRLSAQNTFNPQQRALLAQALEAASPLPSLLAGNENRPPASELNPMNNPLLSSQAEPKTDGTTFVLPLQITVRVLEPVTQTSQPVQPAVPEHRPASAEAVHIDTNYQNRNGYNRRFLPGHEVPLPKLSTQEMRNAAAKVNDVGPNSNPYELKYQHFSIVMNGKRRMAFFTATNIDGATWKNVDRETGQAESAEASEKWYEDPRIAKNEQSDQNLYSRQEPRRIFDRGHLTRRLDPCWGTVARAERANADTFHFTNCTPQESRFNQQSIYWQGIENYVLDNAKAEREKVTVFTGPVFDDNDPEYRYVHVPLQFWKILVRVENDELRATALLANQSPLLTQLPERIGGENFNDLGQVEEYQSTVAEIERLTGLDFGILRAHDTFGGEESVGRRALRGFQDVRLDPESDS